MSENDWKAKTLLWLETNPLAYELFDFYANEIVDAGVNRFGAKLIAERIRWESALRKVEGWKWNNNYTAYVARIWADRNPEHAHRIRFREVQV